MIRTLLIDDDADLRGLMIQMLAHLNLIVVTGVGDGFQALAWLERQDVSPDIIFCDLGMPKMDGIEFLRHLAVRGYGGHIVLISGIDQDIIKAAEHLGRELGLTITGVLEKPFKQSDLAAMIERCGGAAPAARTAAQRIELSPNELREAIRGGWIGIVCQPQVCIRERRLVGVEVLVRMNHPEYGLLQPASFIEVAEASGMMMDITEAAFRQAVRWCGRWNAEDQSITVSVNVSMGNCDMLDLPERLTGWALEHEIDHGQMVIELTETRLVENLTLSLDVVSRLRLKGFGLSIDDFGTGYSTLNKLKQFPFTELKIDREFVDGAVHDPVTRTILEASVSLAKALKLTVVAEGVDGQQDWDFVAALGVDMVQGFFVSRPMPPEQVLAWKRAWEQG